MSQATPRDSKEQILSAFRQLLVEQNKIESKVATKEEEAEKEKNKELLEVASTYTVDSIVNGMASLQLNFGGSIGELSQRLSNELLKLEELKRAIAVESNNREQLRKVRVVADALYILRQEHQEQLRMLAEETARQQETVEKEMTQTRKVWEKERQDFETRIVEQAERIVKQREQEAIDFLYERERDRKIEMDEYEEEKRVQERTLQASDREQEKAWNEREQYLTENAEEFAANQKKIEGFEEEIKQAYNKAKGDAIRDAEREAKVEADLLEKEWEATEQGYQLKITSLEATIERQAAQIVELTTQLQAATEQAQQLAMRAFQGSASRN